MTNSTHILNEMLAGLIVSCVVSMGAELNTSNYPAINDPERDCEYGTEYNLTTNSCPDPNCPNNSSGIFPDCMCTTANFDYSVLLNKCFRVCPDNSTGYWPNCKCHGEAGFDKVNFQCQDCPWDAVIGVFPDCVCEDENARFNAHKNYCETCPTDSSGTIPNCECDDGSEYEEKKNRCRKCPFGSTGIYPSCICDDGGKFDGDVCQRCPVNSHGNYGECICNGTKTYSKDKNLCVWCPWKSVGVYPNCSCIEPLIFDEEQNRCSQCPTNSTGVYPNCVCYEGLFGKANEACIACPSDSDGFYPNCECAESEKIFSAYINECYVPCDDNITGIYPECRCDDDMLYYDIDSKSCKSIIGRTCPGNSIGIGPDCLCMEDKHVFISSLWECDFEYYGTPFIDDSKCSDSSQKWPQCHVNIDGKVIGSLIG